MIEGWIGMNISRQNRLMSDEINGLKYGWINMWPARVLSERMDGRVNVGCCMWGWWMEPCWLSRLMDNRLDGWLNCKHEPWSVSKKIPVRKNKNSDWQISQARRRTMGKLSKCANKWVQRLHKDMKRIKMRKETQHSITKGLWRGQQFDMKENNRSGHAVTVMCGECLLWKIMQRVLWLIIPP